MFTIWNELEHYHDGTSRMQCKRCKNTMRLSRHTVYGFKFCPGCGLPANIKVGVSGKETVMNAMTEMIDEWIKEETNRRLVITELKE